MSSDIERWEPPNDSTAFESLCLDLWRSIWKDPWAQKNGRRGQKQDGVDIFGRENGKLVGVQCKQKDGRLRAQVTTKELEAEAEAAEHFEPKLAKFILATTGPRDAALQKKANQLTEQNRQRGIFAIEVWAWEDIWHELYRRSDLLAKVAPVYWPRRAELQRAQSSNARKHPSGLQIAGAVLVVLIAVITGFVALNSADKKAKQNSFAEWQPPELPENCQQVTLIWGGNYMGSRILISSRGPTNS